MAAKREIDFLLATVAPDQVSLITYNDQVMDDANNTTKSKDLIQGQLKEQNGTISVTDRGSDYFKDLKEYFG